MLPCAGLSKNSLVSLSTPRSGAGHVAGTLPEPSLSGHPSLRYGPLRRGRGMRLQKQFGGELQEGEELQAPVRPPREGVSEF